MTKLMVTPYAPYRDGIAAYAVQEVRRLRADGVDVEVLSPLPSAAHHHLSLGGAPGIARLVQRARSYDSVVLQFSPEMMFGACHNPIERVSVWAGVAALASVTRLEIRLHEIEYGPLERNPAERRVANRALRAAARVTVHTQREIDELISRIGLDTRNVSLLDHGSSFAAATELTRATARAELGLDEAEHVFLAIGFLQEHKGFDQAVEAFGRANLDAQASLHVVGSVRVDHPELVAYARRLRLMCSATRGARLHEKYVSDEEFDRWIVAADTIVLPYREIWSSGVMERAKLFDRAVIAADVGGMADQAPTATLFFSDIESLIQAFKERANATADAPRDPAAGAEAGAARSAAVAAGRDPVDEPWEVDRTRPERTDVEAQIRRRVRRRHLQEGHHDAGSDGTPGRRAAVDPLLALEPVHRPHAVSARRGVSELKQVIRRVMNWEIEPVVTQLDALQRATVEAVAQLDARISALSHQAAEDLDEPGSRPK